MATVRAHVMVSGHVHGVGFRWAVERVAREQGLAGWVRNRRDGRVEAAFEGSESAVNAALELCRRGPSSARVENVQVTWESTTGEREFRIEATA